MAEDPRRTRRALLAGTAGAVAALAGCPAFGDTERTTRTVTRRLDADSETAVALDNFNGPVTVEGHDGDQVVVEAEISGAVDDVDGTTVDTTRNGNTVRVETDHQESFLGSLFGSSRVAVTLTVRCPTSVAVEQVTAANGPIEVRNVDGAGSLTTENGDVTATGVGVLGDVSTANGSIDVDVPAIEGDVLVEVTNGNIEAALGSALDATVTAEVTNGTIEVGDGLDLRRTGDGVSGTLGDGTHDLSFEAANGTVTLRSAGN